MISTVTKWKDLFMTHFASLRYHFIISLVEVIAIFGKFVFGGFEKEKKTN